MMRAISRLVSSRKARLVASAAIGLGIAAGVQHGGLTTRVEAAPGDEAALLPDTKMRLITQSQYVNSLQRIFGNDIEIRVRFAPVKRVDGLLALGSNSTILTSGALDPLDATARSIAAQVVDVRHRRFTMPCVPANPTAADAECARTFITRTGRLLFRRPLDGEELAKYLAMANEAVGKGGDFYGGIAYALSGMLVSPQFLYINEEAKPVPGGSAWQLDPYSKATRLSFLLWNSSPDDALLTAAEQGELDNPKGLAREVERMIASPLYVDGVREFFGDFLALEEFDNLAKDPTIYPAFSLKAVLESREQMLLTVVDQLVTRKGDYRDLFVTRDTFMSSELGAVYRVPVNSGAAGWLPYRFPDDGHRAGLLSQAGFLAQYAHAGRSSPTRRGRAIREVLLCQKVPDPPPKVDFSKFEDPKGGLHTARERLTAHNENPVCAGCHKITDPIGLSLENFDGAGQFRTAENATPIDATGVLDGVAFSDPAGLGHALRDNPSLKSCIVNRLFSYSTGRKVEPQDEPKLENYLNILDQRGYRFDEMLKLIVLDPMFFAVKPPAQVAIAPNQGGANAYQR